MIPINVRCWRRPGWLAWILLLSGVALFGRLGFWQLDRAQEKADLLIAFDSMQNTRLEDFSSVRDTVATERYPHIRVQGQFDSTHSYLLDNQIHEGHLGVQVFALFRIVGDSRALLVNRGWLARPEQNLALPELPPLPQNDIELHGWYAPLPSSGIRLGGNALPGQSHWPKLSIYIDAKEISQDSGNSLYPRQLLLDPEPNSGFLREWTPHLMSPAQHHAYALQWFALALATVVIFLTMHFRQSKSE